MRLPISMVVWFALLVVAATVAASSFAPSLQHFANRWRQAASAQPTQPDPRLAVYRGNIRIVLSAALEVLAEQRISVRFVNIDQGVIHTDSINVSQARLRQLAAQWLSPTIEQFGRSGGRYLLQIRARPNSPTETMVRVDSLIILNIVSESAQGGQTIPSSMLVEREFLQRLAAKLRNP